MSLTISGGGGGGGITIETDPTALKKASNLADLTNVAIARANIGIPAEGISYIKIADWDITRNYAYGEQVIYNDKFYRQTSDGAGAGYQPDIYPEIWAEISAGGSGGGSFNGGTVTTAVIGDAGYGMAVLDPDYEGAPRFYVGDSGSSVFTSITPAGIQLANLGIGLTLNNWQITFSDGTVQTTAYTGGGGGSGTAVQQRYADAIATLVATPTYGWDGGIYISAQWAFTSAYNNNSVTYEYPKFIDSMGGEYAIAIYVSGVYLPVVYVDSNNITGWIASDFAIYDTVKFAVTSTVNGTGFEDSTTTAISFPTGVVSYTPA